MSRDVIHCYEDEDAEAAARLMQERQVRRVLVINHDERLVGIVSLGDLAAETAIRDGSGGPSGLSEPAIPRR